MVLCFGMAPLLGSSSLPVPALFGGISGGVPIPLVLAALPAGTLLYCLNRPPADLEATAARRTSWWSSGLLIAACGTAILLGIVEQSWLDFPLAWAVTRNMLGYLGVGLLAQWLLGPRYGPVTVAILPLVSALVGTGPGGRPYPWAWPLLPSGSAHASLAALALLIAGTALCHARPNHTFARGRTWVSAR
ncbi:hypothetical protein [Streptomyces sp. JJ38]|uniref:hypothetical protein n=1 Tax=Streptomyces sp. JJ38 TaxID=2738128 RepID=UPI001C595933|nr:hypothetical protein [Streptomyces sp. JJ38]MBW1597801.1 hypothetical protein [Streptomyces sp. JJ38]